MNQRTPYLYPVDKAVTFLVDIQTTLCGAPTISDLMEEDGRPVASGSWHHRGLDLST